MVNRSIKQIKQRNRDSSVEVLDQAEEGKGGEPEEYVMIDEDEAVIDFHMHHNLNKEPSLKQKFFKQM